MAERMNQKHEQHICEGCLQPIEHNQPAVAPSWGFGWFHKLCWQIEENRIKQEHHEHDAMEAMKGGEDIG